jgi:hypothetical protein
MVDQYPHIMKVHIPATGGYDEDSGEYTEAPEYEYREVQCRAIPNGAGKKVDKVDGTQIVYEYDVAFPMGTDGIPNGVAIEVPSVFQGKKELIRFHKGQLHSRGWI